MIPRYPFVCALPLLMLACGESDGGSDEPDVPAEAFEMGVGALDASGDFQTLSPSDTVEIVVGFQGLIFVDLLLSIPEHVPWRFNADCEVSFAAEPDFDFGFWVNRLTFDPLAGGQRAELRIPFGQDVSLIDGHDLTVSIRLLATGWEADQTVSFHIADDERCIENPDGELECE